MIQSPLTLLKTFRLIAIFVLVLLSTRATVFAQPFTLGHTFDDPTPTEGDWFSRSVALDGNHVLIGAPNDDTNGELIGQAHLFDATSGNLLRTFDDPTPTTLDRFGRSVALQGDRVLIGAPSHDTSLLNVGQAQLFDTNGELLQTFDNPTPAELDWFGRTVALDGNHVLIGSIYDHESVGQAHLFDLAGNLLQTFDDPTPTPSEYFSLRIAIDGNHILIGAMGDDTNGPNVGQAHLFDTNGELLHTFDDPTPTELDTFGRSVALDGNHVLIGASGDDTNGENVGQAHLFDLAGNLLQTFDDPTATFRNEFGNSVALDGNQVLIGGPYTNEFEEDGGQAHLFDLAGNLLQTFNDPTPTSPFWWGDSFGFSVALDDYRVLVSAAGDDTNGSGVGQAFLFTAVTDADFNHDGLIDCTDVDGLVMEIAAGSHDPAFDLTGDGVVNLSDLDEWRAQGGAANLPSGNPYFEGDANLDGTVDGADFFAWNNNKFTNVAAWCSGDFNADGLIDGADFLLWNNNKFTSSDGLSAVPEPGLGVLLIASLLGLAFVRRR